jgi:hypothetical protein
MYCNLYLKPKKMKWEKNNKNGILKKAKIDFVDLATHSSMIHMASK